MPRVDRAQRFLANPHAFMDDPAVQLMGLEARGAYAMLWLAGWDQKEPGVYVADDRVLAQLSRCTAEEWSRVKAEVATAFDVTARDRGRRVWVLHAFSVTLRAQNKKRDMDRIRQRLSRLRRRDSAKLSQCDSLDGSGSGSGSGSKILDSESKAGADAPFSSSHRPPNGTDQNPTADLEAAARALWRPTDDAVARVLAANDAVEPSPVSEMIAAYGPTRPVPQSDVSLEPHLPAFKHEPHGILMGSAKLDNSEVVKPPASLPSRVRAPAEIRSLIPDIAEVCKHAGSDATRGAISLVQRLARGGIAHRALLMRFARHYLEHRANVRNPYAYYNPGGRGFAVIKLQLAAHGAFEEHEAIKQAELAWKGHRP